MDNNRRSFEYENETIEYIIKDIETMVRKGKEMASAHIVFYRKNHNYILWPLYDEANKICYGLPYHAKEWYEEYLQEKQKEQ